MKTLIKQLFPPAGESAWTLLRPCQEVCGATHACKEKGDHGYRHVCSCGFRWAS